MLKNLYQPPSPKKTELVANRTSMFTLNVLTYGYSRLKNFLQKNPFSIMCQFSSCAQDFQEGEPIIVFYEYLGEDNDVFVEFYNHLKTIYSNSKIYFVLDDCYEGLITLEFIEKINNSIQVDGWTVVTSNLKINHKNVINLHYHLFDKAYDNTTVAETAFSPNLNLRNKKFICLNRAERIHRFETVLYLFEKELIKDTHVSCQNIQLLYQVDNIDPIKMRNSDAKQTLGDIQDQRLYSGFHEIKNHNFNEEQLDILRNKLPLWIEQEDTILLNPKNMPNSKTIHNDSYWALVTERDFYRSNVYEGYTEKTVKCLLYGIPFIIIGLPHTLRHLREQGFFTFESFIDESYDDIEDDYQRFEEIKKQIDYLSSLNYNELDLMYKKMLPLLEYNYNHLQRIHQSSVSGKLSNLVQQWYSQSHRA